MSLSGERGTLSVTRFVQQSQTERRLERKHFRFSLLVEGSIGGSFHNIKYHYFGDLFGKAMI